MSVLNALEPHGEPNGSAIARVRAVIEGFQQYEDVLIRQMCHVNVRGRVVARGTVDAETGEELARFTIEFDSGSFAYIPLDTNAEDRLRDKELPFFPLDAFSPNEDIEIPMQMAQAIEFGVLDTGTVQKIQAFPPVSRNPNWTFWHQLKGFFAHYTRDVDAPMRWSDEALRFWMPPVFHPNIKRLLLISPTLSESYLRSAFPGEEIEIVHTEPIAWVREMASFNSALVLIHYIQF